MATIRPTFTGFVDDTREARHLIYAARQGSLSLITRPLRTHELKAAIRSGAVFVFDVQENGIKQWKDGLHWSSSTRLGHLTAYQQIDHDHEFNSRTTFLELTTKTLTVNLDSKKFRIISYETPQDVYLGWLRRPTDCLKIIASDNLHIPPDVENSQGSMRQLVDRVGCVLHRAGSRVWPGYFTININNSVVGSSISCPPIPHMESRRLGYYAYFARFYWNG